MEEYNFSLIVPHKNSIDLLKRCLATIPKRSDIQVIVVDDNSDIAEEEWRIFRKENDHVELFLTNEGGGQDMPEM